MTGEATTSGFLPIGHGGFSVLDGIVSMSLHFIIFHMNKVLNPFK